MQDGRQEHKLYAGLSFSRNILTLYLKPEQKLTKAALIREILSGVQKTAGRSTFTDYQRSLPIDIKETSVKQPNTSKLPSLSIRLWYALLVHIFLLLFIFFKYIYFIIYIYIIIIIIMLFYIYMHTV